MKNTLKAIAIVAGALLAIAAFIGAAAGALWLTIHGHGLPVGIIIVTVMLVGMVWLIKHDLDRMDAADEKKAAATP